MNRQHRVRSKEPKVTQLVQNRRLITVPLAGIVLAAALVAAIFAGIAFVAVDAISDARAAEVAAAQAAEDATWLRYGQDWESRYRQISPTSR